MFERINKKVKGFFSSQRMKTLALMLLVGTTAAMAQNAAGDYSAGTTALSSLQQPRHCLCSSALEVKRSVRL